MNKIKKKSVFTSIFLFVILAFLFKIYRERTVDMKVVLGRETEYKYFERRLTVKDFEDFNYDTTWNEFIEKIGQPNGTCAFGNPYPYYELNNGKFIVCQFLKENQINQIRLCNESRMYEYFLLPPRLFEMTKEQKQLEKKNAQSYELNVVLDLFSYNEWNRSSSDNEFKDDPMGEYSNKSLSDYSDKDININFNYYFGTFAESGLQELFQIIESYEDGKLKQLGFEVWRKKCNQNNMYFFIEEDGNALNISISDTSLSSIQLIYKDFANSIKGFLLDRKEIRKGLDAWVEFWGVDENGSYMCLFVTSLLKRDWGVNIPNNLCSYYYVTINTKDDIVDTVHAKLLKKIG